MKKQVIKITILFLLLLAGALSAAAVLISRSVETPQQNELVLLNEIWHLTLDENGNNPARSQIETIKKQITEVGTDAQKVHIWQLAAVLFIVAAIFVIFVPAYLYLKVIRPFQRLESFAERVAKGDLNIRLNYERTNFFGAFTWAFDHMREEIVTARENEAQAINENKTIIATLSHDIKTPIASIRAYAEGLEANLEAGYEQRERYVRVIMNKCDEVTRLTNDLVLHSLSELERLEIKCEKIDIVKLLSEVLSDLEYPNLSLREPVPYAVVNADAKRMAQILENLINNARKYAHNSKITVWGESGENQYHIHVRDYGAGIPPEDMPFIFDKFYRGKNVGQQPGSGLGLYIVKYIMNRMNGEIELNNHEDGLEAVLGLSMECSTSSSSI